MLFSFCFIYTDIRRLLQNVLIGGITFIKQTLKDCILLAISRESDLKPRCHPIRVGIVCLCLIFESLDDLYGFI